MARARQRLSYAGVTLPLQTPQHQHWLDQVHPRDFLPADFWNFSSPALAALPTPDIPINGPPQAGVLFWPTGAVNPAFFHCVLTTAQLDRVRTALGNPQTPGTLVLDDGRDGYRVEAERMFLLPPRPLNQLGHAASDAWWCTLADERFFSWWRSGSVSATPASWQALMESLAAQLGWELTVEAVPAAYQTPSSKWVQFYRPLAVMLDAAAYQVGQRVVKNLDGTFRTVSWQTAKAESDTYLAAAGAVVSGGVLVGSDIARSLPAAVTVMFPDNTTGTVAAEPFASGVTLASLSGSGLDVVYGAATGVSGWAVPFVADYVYTPAAASGVPAVAGRSALDWYGWRAQDLDIVWPGVEPWQPTGWEDQIEWAFQKRAAGPFASTTVRRGPFTAMPSGDWRPAAAGTATAATTTLVVLDAKTYTPGEYIEYAGERVTFTPPDTYTRTGEQITPLYEVRDRDVPAMIATGLAEDVPDCPAGGSIGYTFTLDATEYTLIYQGSGVYSCDIDGGTATLTIAAGAGTLTFSGTASYDAYVYDLDPWACTGDVTLAQAGGSGPATLALTEQFSAAMAPLVHCLSVFPYWPDPDGGSFYLFQGEPWEDLQRLTASSTPNGTVAPFRRFNQNTGVWEDGEVCGGGTMLMVPAE